MAKKSFENKLARIAEIAEALDKGDVLLDNSLKLYEEAVKTAKELRDELEVASGSVVIMRKTIGGDYFAEDAEGGF